MRKQHVTSVRLDDFQRMALVRIGSSERRSMSNLIQLAIDRYVEEELQLSRRAIERELRKQRDQELLAGFEPKPFRVPTDEEMLVGE